MATTIAGSATDRVHTNISDSGVAVLTLNNPPVNAADQHLYTAIKAAIEEAELKARVIVLTGEGDRAFCGGNDLHEFVAMDGESAEHHMRVAREAFWALLDCRVPLIGAINGPAIGTGFALTACCDFVLASERATFAFPEIKAGVLGGMKFGARMLPEQAVRRMFFLGSALTASEIKALGAPIEIVAHEDLLCAAVSLAEEIAQRSPLALQLAKESMRVVETLPLKQGYEAEQRYTIRLATSPDSKEAVKALLEHRPPKFQASTDRPRL